MSCETWLGTPSMVFPALERCYFRQSWNHFVLMKDVPFPQLMFALFKGNPHLVALVPLIFHLSEVKEPPRTTAGNRQAFSSSGSWPSTPCMEGDGTLQLLLKDKRAAKGSETQLLGQNGLGRIAARSLGSTGVMDHHPSGARSPLHN